ncbi:MULTISPECIES: DUF6328 family protein [Streptomyces]|jgi:small-conductance mechanosensitive channel|uniref:Small-conductance mechanosensitive channel n=1 Tax=Streptomyces nymphaeiformis TaxID=2663842 RepID=A0A7W7XA42_9ACTN|nr:DUF6328 family protein [Streptomyces nymphaeiformis]MBB4980540.1 small-conductance mechanosensitive channel [Streptomyces nymphaeiformis]
MAADDPNPREGLRHGRNETEEERADRRWTDIMQEIRVAQTGVQILLGFLLTVVFTPIFQGLERADKTIYVITIVLASLATSALIGPVAFHRVVSGRRMKPRAVTWAARLTFAGLVLLVATLTSALLLVLRVATRNTYVPWLVAVVFTWYLVCWFALPLWVRFRHTSDE